MPGTRSPPPRALYEVITMKYWTVHLKPGQVAFSSPPVLVQEGFSWGAFFFGPLWLLAHHAWVPAILVLAVNVIAGTLATAAAQPFLFLGISLLIGLSGNDLRRSSLEQKGYVLMHVVAARDTDGALARLLDSRPELAGSFANGFAA